MILPYVNQYVTCIGSNLLTTSKKNILGSLNYSDSKESRMFEQKIKNIEGLLLDFWQVFKLEPSIYNLEENGDYYLNSGIPKIIQKYENMFLVGQMKNTTSKKPKRKVL